MCEVFIDPKKVNIEYDESVWETFRQHQQKHREAESGGILVGEIYPESSKIIVKKAIVSLKAKRTLYGIRIDMEEMQSKLDFERKESGYTYYYLGNWHTHPEPYPTPSWTDKWTYRKNTKEVELVSNFILFTIIGNAEDIYKSLWQQIYFLDR